MAGPSMTHQTASPEDLPSPVGSADVDWKVLVLFSSKKSFMCPGKLPRQTWAQAQKQESVFLSVQPVFILDLFHLSSLGLVPSSILLGTSVPFSHCLFHHAEVWFKYGIKIITLPSTTPSRKVKAWQSWSNTLVGISK